VTAPDDAPILIAGGSLGGLFAANILHRAGFPVLVLERSRVPLAGRGAGIVTHPELFEALERAGVTIDDGIGVRVPGRVLLARDGAIEARRDLPQILTAWGRLHNLLRRALPDALYHLNAGVTSFVQDPDGVDVTLADGAQLRGRALVAADGLRSTVRATLVPDAKPLYAGYVAWRGLAPEESLSARTRADIFERFAFCLPPGEQMLGYPVAGADDSVATGARRYNFVWYRPAAAETTLIDMLTDASGRVHADGIAPDAIRPSVRQGMLAATTEVLAPQFAEIVAKSGTPFFQPILDFEAPFLARGRVALLGDAAFVARPHLGMGVTKAGSDARALADALLAYRGDIPAAFAAYEARRLPAGRALVAHARRLGAYMQAQLKTADERAMAQAYRSPAAVLRETAVPPEPATFSG
jgi:2-polyprenyl-6-methoxyphenol hydroxylase-like FAD-dependent oxidoreductase